MNIVKKKSVNAKVIVRRDETTGIQLPIPNKLRFVFNNYERKNFENKMQVMRYLCEVDYSPYFVILYFSISKLS